MRKYWIDDSGRPAAPRREDHLNVEVLSRHFDGPMNEPRGLPELPGFRCAAMVIDDAVRVIKLGHPGPEFDRAVAWIFGESLGGEGFDFESLACALRLDPDAIRDRLRHAVLRVAPPHAASQRPVPPRNATQRQRENAA